MNIHQHLGLGDHIICNGLIRTLHKQYGKLNLFVYNKNKVSVDWMFSDLKDFSTITVDSDIHAMSYHTNINGYSSIGFNYLRDNPDIGFDKAFYKQCGVDFQERWNSFFVPEPDDEIFKYYKIDGDFIFVHQDKKRNMLINNSKLSYKQIIEPNIDFTNNIFKYLPLIRMAKEIHCIESSFLFLIDSYNFGIPLFNHRYARSYPENNTPTLKQNWKIL